MQKFLKDKKFGHLNTYVISIAFFSNSLYNDISISTASL